MDVTISDTGSGLQAVTNLVITNGVARITPSNPEPVGRARAEVEAESVAYIVCQRAGLATTEYSLPYGARWSGGDVDVVRSTADRVLGAARKILHGLGLTDIDGGTAPA